MSTNYTNAFIVISPDSVAASGIVPGKPETIAGMQYALLRDRPYELTSDELLFEVHCLRSGIPAAESAEARAQFFSRSHACLRASPLVKQYGWGIHHDEASKIALYGVGTADYRRLSQSPDLTIVAGMRNKRAKTGKA
jgi:hypothetical protein